MYSKPHYRADARFPGTPLFAVALLVFSILATPLRAMLGNYTRSVILTVAASNSSADLQAEADYLCTGTNDQTQIQAALNALPSNGGRVVLLEGTYNIFATIRIEKDSTTLEGQGAGQRAGVTQTGIGTKLLTASGLTVRSFRCRPSPTRVPFMASSCNTSRWMAAARASGPRSTAFSTSRMAARTRT